jgi:hypothetical protein
MKRKNPVFILYLILLSISRTFTHSIFSRINHGFLNSGPGKIGIISAIFLSLSLISLGQKTWDGGGDGINWSSANNWAPNGVPLSTDNVIITRNGVRTINLNGNFSCASLTLDYSGNTNGTISLNFLNTNSLIVTNGVSLVNQATNGGSNVLLDINNGSLSCSSLVFTQSGSATSDISVSISYGPIVSINLSQRNN